MDIDDTGIKNVINVKNSNAWKINDSEKSMASESKVRVWEYRGTFIKISKRLEINIHVTLDFLFQQSEVEPFMVAKAVL